MLRLTQRNDAGPTTLCAEGELVDRWVDILEHECHRLMATSPTLRLDLRGVTYLDPEAVRRLQALTRLGVTLGECPPLISAMLEED